jgi:nucleotide-binding universal stress UspA family protein
MKILLCVDGSPHSDKAIAEAITIAGGCSADEVTLINVYESRFNLPETTTDRLPLTRDDIERFEKLSEQEREERKTLIEEAVNKFEAHGIKVNTALECGHPAETIARYASEGGFSMIIIGSRGLGGLKKLLLGSVSNAVLQEAKCSVLVVK